MKRVKTRKKIRPKKILVADMFYWWTDPDGTIKIETTEKGTAFIERQLKIDPKFNPEKYFQELFTDAINRIKLEEKSIVKHDDSSK